MTYSPMLEEKFLVYRELKTLSPVTLGVKEKNHVPAAWPVGFQNSHALRAEEMTAKANAAVPHQRGVALKWKPVERAPGSDLPTPL